MIKYDLTLIPLGLVKIEENKLNFTVNIVSNLSFKDSASINDINHAINNHPIIGERINPPIGIITVKNRQIITTNFIKTATNFSKIRENLTKYLIEEPSTVLKLDENQMSESRINNEKKIDVINLENDDIYDQLIDKDIVDSANIHDLLIKKRDTAGLLFASGNSTSLNFTSQDFSVRERVLFDLEPKKNKYFNNLASQAALAELLQDDDDKYLSLGTLFANLNLNNNEDFVSLFQEIEDNSNCSIKTQWEKFKGRIAGNLVKEQSNLKIESFSKKMISEEKLAKGIEQRDPNLLIQSAFKEPLLCKKLGFVTKWNITVPKEHLELLKNNNFEMKLEIPKFSQKKYIH